MEDRIEHRDAEDISQRFSGLKHPGLHALIHQPQVKMLNLQFPQKFPQLVLHDSCAFVNNCGLGLSHSVELVWTRFFTYRHSEG